MSATKERLLVIMPAHNEAAVIRACLDSFVIQTRPPDQLLVVDDSSTDGTAEIVLEYSRKFPWIQYLRHPSSGGHKPGAKVVRCFKHGLKQAGKNWDFIGKFDADIVLPENYFEKVVTAFRANPRLGICGGHLYVEAGNRWIYENIANEDHIRGPIKCYRSACLEAMGGLRPFIGWDTADMILARYSQFETLTLHDLHVRHLRPTGSAYSARHGRKQGASFYQLRYGLLLSGIASLKLAWKRRNPRLPIQHFKGYLEAKASAQGGRLLNAEEGRFARQLRWKGVRSRLI